MLNIVGGTNFSRGKDVLELNTQTPETFTNLPQVTRNFSRGNLEEMI